MKNFKRAIAVFLVVVSVISFTGCDNNKTLSDGSIKEYELFLFQPDNPYKPDSPVWKYAAEKTGVRLKNVVSDAATSESTAYSTMLATGDLPEIIATKAVDLRTLATDGGLVPLDDLIDKYAPNLKAFYEKYPEAVQYSGNGDGHIYFIPNSTSGMENAIAETYFIRQDWLDKLGLKTPTTVEEYHDVLLAFKTQDPNGNGKADEVPYFCRIKNLNGLVQLFGTTTWHYADYKTGDYKFGPVTEEYKTAMRELSKWFKEGLIDNEIFTRNSAREQLFGQNIGGSTHDYIPSTVKFNDSLKESVPGFNLVGFLPPKNSKGDVVSLGATSKISGRGWGISSTTDEKDLETLIKYLDFWMSDEGCDLGTYGVEGETYTRDKDGNIVWCDEALAYENGISAYLYEQGACNYIGTNRRADLNRYIYNESGRDVYDLYTQSGVITPYVLPSLNYNEEESAAISKYGTNVSTIVDEYVQNWILGKADVDATWDEYINKLNNQGLQKYMGAYESAYARIR